MGVTHTGEMETEGVDTKEGETTKMEAAGEMTGDTLEEVTRTMMTLAQQQHRFTMTGSWCRTMTYFDDT